MLDKLLNKLSKHSKQSLSSREFSEPEQIKRARQYIDLHEVRDNAVLKKLLKLDPAKTPWCAGFVNVIEKQCGRKGTGKLLARSFLKYGTPVRIPAVGDIVIFQRGNSSWQGHVAYYISEDSRGVLALGGNQSNKVCYSYYPKSKVLGFVRP